MRAQEYEALGDEEVYAGTLAYAKQRYGAAIDEYLRESNYEAAIRTCQKLIRVAPDVVRTHYTLAYLLVGEGRTAEAVAALNRYGAAVESSGAVGYAWTLLTLLAQVTDDSRSHPIKEGCRRRMRMQPRWTKPR